MNNECRCQDDEGPACQVHSSKGPTIIVQDETTWFENRIANLVPFEECLFIYSGE